MKKHGDIRYSNHCGVRQLRGCYDRVLDIACASSVQRDRFDLQLASRNLDWLKKIIASVDRRFRVENNPDSTDMWRDLCEQFQPLLADRGFKIGESRYVSVRMREFTAKPLPTGSDTLTNTTGIVRVSAKTAVVAGVDDVRITSGLIATSSLASLRLVAESRRFRCSSNRTLRPSLHPSRQRASLKAPISAVVTGSSARP